MEIKPFKIRVRPEQNIIVQRIILLNDYRWSGGGILFESPSYPFLFFYDREYLDDERALSYGTNEDTFDESVINEISFNEFMRLYSRKKIKFGR